MTNAGRRLRRWRSRWCTVRGAARHTPGPGTASGQTVNVNLSRPNPNFGALNVNTSIGLAWYNAMLIELKHRFRDGFQFGVTYTLALAENTGGAGDGGGHG